VPELLEVESYRQIASQAIGRRIETVEVRDTWFVKGDGDPDAVVAALERRRFVADRRIGKLLLLDTDDGATLGVRFGMTGVLEMDGVDGIDGLVYGSARRNPVWERFIVHFVGGGSMRVRDARRLGGVELDPDESRLGPDATTIDRATLSAVLAGSAAPVKARLMDQSRVAGLGNLLTDDLLWRARLDPTRTAGSLDAAEIRRLHTALRATLRVLGRRGGSHTGDLQVQRHRDGHCPRCGALLQRGTVGGRTTYWCTAEQL
jgi:formamidopyrimidine-DNA glycosylase